MNGFCSLQANLTRLSQIIESDPFFNAIKYGLDETNGKATGEVSLDSHCSMFLRAFFLSSLLSSVLDKAVKRIWWLPKSSAEPTIA